MSYRYPLGLFRGVGVELEYMVVDRETLDVRTVADELIRAECGAFEAEIDRGTISWSNELALHVLELKTTGPAPRLDGLAAAFQEQVRRANDLLEGLGAMLLPTAMHPWMDPLAEFRRWPHEYSAVYEAYDRIFDCRGHGWANLQSAHVNLPFADDAEFGRLHAALRLLLPILPALAASSPVADGKPTGLLDTRLDAYRRNALAVPSVTARVVPEPVFTRAEYEVLLQGIYDDLAPLDADGVLRHEWVNARGCIARFDRGSIEIRLLDVQECPAADLAIVAAVVAATRWLVDRDLRDWPTEPLAAILDLTVRDADRAVLDDARYLEALGCTAARCTAGEAWADLVERTGAASGELATILEEGCLARRILAALDREEPGRERLAAVYRELGRCLAEGALFHGSV